MFNEKLDNVIIIKEKDGKMSVEIRGDFIDLATMLHNVFLDNRDFFNMVKCAVSAHEDYTECEKLNGCEKIKYLPDKLENVAKKLN